ncbi:DUF6191 domain-containing protein [Kitasatospora purpeofusca]|uniref:DUF6191 domain-containing protein n=1 Tax=Kitasatospora purpeofusca TaxID=67352 RepID=UPI00224F5151|nr:DUF6191 domain-containing protein [Kitasatospora purpeofusca]MCX4757906.1 DUF6191 domain-containing protein [Kitasatospora purpeofusca]WSR31607.1 DUF6191 domain-containing protein [Kitasatospora purpeofusca]WSR39631.1 DUF6191 domain-containing protein [Kitasatospora purpeofusca]
MAVVMAAAVLVTGLVALAVVVSNRRNGGPEVGSGSSDGLGMSVFEELHALFHAGKRVHIEQRQARLVLRDDDHATAPPGHGIDLDAGTAVVIRRRAERGSAEGPPGG